MDDNSSTANEPRPPGLLDRAEYIEQAYFFRTMRERMGQNLPAQEVLGRVHEEILSTTRLPMAIEFLATEIKHSGVLAPAFVRLAHYFTPFQAFVIERAEAEQSRFSADQALLVLEREATYKAGRPIPAGLFVYQLETLSRNRLGYDHGLAAVAGDPLFDSDWSDWIRKLRGRIGMVDFADLVYLRSEWYAAERRRQDPDFEPERAILFGEKEGRIAKANHGKDPLYLFAALQRQLGYPEVPRPSPPDEERTVNRIAVLERKLSQLETRLKLVESEAKGELDLTRFYAKPDDTAREADSPGRPARPT